jgi:peptidoglycan biosynthesis protein MviN/MurJ (putative lipid II flippase)
MKIAVTISRVLLGLLFTVFGANGFLHFIPMPPPTGLAGQYMGALFVSHYLVVVFLVQLVGGILLLANRYVPLALILLGPVIVNIVSFHAFLAPEGLPLALFATVLWLVVFSGVRSAFAGVFAQKV